MMQKRDPIAHLSSGGIRSLLLSSSPCSLFFGHFESDVGELEAEILYFFRIYFACSIYSSFSGS